MDLPLKGGFNAVKSSSRDLLLKWRVPIIIGLVLVILTLQILEYSYHHTAFLILFLIELFVLVALLSLIFLLFGLFRQAINEKDQAVQISNSNTSWLWDFRQPRIGMSWSIAFYNFFLLLLKSPMPRSNYLIPQPAGSKPSLSEIILATPLSLCFYPLSMLANKTVWPHPAPFVPCKPASG